MARPTKPQKEVKNEIVKARVTAEEKSEIEQKAKLAGMTTSEYVARCAVSKKFKPKVAPEILPELKTLRSELGNIGNILNQLVGTEQADKEISIAKYDHVLAQLQKINTEIIKILSP